jgi:hypothetical protein
MCEIKICSKCKQEKLKTEFHKDSYKKDGLRSECKNCTKEYNAKYNASPEVKAHKKECNAKYHAKPEVRARRKERDLRPESKERRKKYNSRPETKARRNDRYNNDLSFRLRRVVSTAIGGALKRNNGSKRGDSAMKYLPYTIKDLKVHLERQFDDKMSWENYGTEWHIDHICPQSKLPYDSMQHPNFQKAWALKNLRPLEASENLSKNDKIDEALLKEYGLESYIENN